ncbi:MAG: primosomal protein N' [Candidatus Saccharimonadales bacterium]
MHYYEVLVGDMQYHGHDALTYSAAAEVSLRSIVVVGLRARQVVGVVVKEVSKPSFAVKPLTRKLAESAPLPAQTLELLLWLKGYYPAPLGAIVRQFLPGNVVKPKQVVSNSSATNNSNTMLPPLTSEQKTTLDGISNSGLHILHGATGTGKTRIYIELAKRSLQDGKSSIILTPEIGLTAQLVASFESEFTGKTIVFHSQLTSAARRDLWFHILNARQPIIVIGPRSALFTPVQNIGLIVVDEAHEAAYKNESAPHYATSRVAAKLAALHDAPVIIGSATPSVDDYYVASKKNRPILAMTTPATDLAETHVDTQIVDLKDHSLFTASPVLSRPLIQAITTALDNKEQSLLFLNRRGTAKIVLCNDCGWQVHCPRCDLPLTYHGDEHQMRCHVCGYHAVFPNTCPVCDSSDLLLKSVGTKAVVSEVQRLFPSARLQRFDSDTSGTERLEQNMSTLKSGAVDILIGTQTIAKGLDLPKLAVVGIINADTSLYIPDYTAAEHTYQLLSQVLGRVGRGHRKGYAVIQTYTPGSEALGLAVKGDWKSFYENELVERERYNFPPFCYLLKLACLRASNSSAEQASSKLAAGLTKAFPRATIDGPTPAFHSKLDGKYRWQLIVKSKQRSDLISIIGSLPSGWSYDIDPINLL